MADMIKFFKGLEASLPTSGVNGALYITTDEGAIYLGTGTGMKRLGDFVQVDNVASLPEKAHESCLYYCVVENILAKWNGTEWKQINKQPTAEELKGLLGLGSLAYLSEVSEANLDASLKEKVNAAAEGNHSHANKALLDTYTQTEANLADAVAKKHAHANADELAKIVDGDKAKWDAVVADHLTSADKTTLENAIKEAKKAGTDANTNIETYKVANDARVLAVEEDVAEIVDGTNGILAQAKAYADGKDSAIAEAKKAGTDANAALEAYKTSNNEALAGVKATADAAAVKTEVEAELAKKVDKVEGKSLVADSEITKLAGVSEGANKVEASTNGKIKIDGQDVTVYTHPEKHTVSEISDFETKIASYDYATKTEAQAMADGKDEAIAAAKKAGDDAQDAVDALGEYVGTIPTTYTETNVIAYINKKAEETLAAAQGGSSETAASVKQQLDNYKSENDTRVKAAEDAIALKADKSVVEAMYTNDQIDGFLAGKVDKETYAEDKATFALKTDLNAYRTSADQDVIDEDFEERIAELEAIDHDQLAADASAAAVATVLDGAPEKFNTLKEIAAWIAEADTAEDAASLVTRVSALEAIDHDAYVDADAELKEELEGQINAINNHSHTFVESELNKIADGDVAKWNAEIGAKELAASKTTTAEVKAQIEAYGYATEADLTLAEGRISALEGVKDDYKAADATLKSELQAEIDADVKVVNDALEAYKTSNNAEVALKANSADVYAKSETYTKSEIEALMTWGSF